MKIEDICLKNNIFLAPMAGYTNIAFRLLCAEMGWGMTFTEYIKDDSRYLERSYISDSESNVAAQLMGADPEILLSLAQRIIKKHPNISFININMGCPFVDNIGYNEGCALMRTPYLIEKIIYLLSCHIHLPITIKIRKGFSDDLVNYKEISKIAEKNGAKAIFIHARTMNQIYSGPVDLDCIREIKQSVDILVIGNGGIENAEDAFNMMRYTNCDGIMIGRAGISNPLIINDLVQNNDKTYKSKMDAAVRYIELGSKYSSYIEFSRFKKSLITLLHSKDTKDIRFMININRANNYEELKKLI